jgi:siroheme synthase
MEKADVIVYDHLNPSLRAWENRCRTHLCGQRGNSHHEPDEINRLIVEGYDGLMVVRLKGRDRFIFGRREEAQTGQTGVPFEIVPG